MLWPEICVLWLDNKTILLILNYFLNVCFVLFCRISDRGGGMPHNQMSQVFDYGFTTSGREKEDSRVNRGLFGVVIENRAAGTMHGWDNNMVSFCW